MIEANEKGRGDPVQFDVRRRDNLTCPNKPDVRLAPRLTPANRKERYFHRHVTGN